MSSNHPDHLSTHAKTGLVALSAVCSFLFFIPTQHNRAPVLGEKYKLVFHDVQGLAVSNPVTVGGVEAGRVTGIDFAPRSTWKQYNRTGDDTPVVFVTVGLSPGFHLPPLSGYKILANLKGLREVNILPGTGDGQRVTPGSIVNAELEAEGTSGPAETLSHVEELVASTRETREQYTSPAFQRNLKDTASNFRFYSSELLARGKGARKQLQSAEAELDQQQQAILNQIDHADAQLAQMRKKIDTDMVGQAHDKAGEMKSQLASMNGQVDSMLGQALTMTHNLRGYIVGSKGQPGPATQLKALGAQAHSMAERMDEYAALAHDFHGLTSDVQVQKDLRGKFKDLKGRSEDLKSAAAGLEAISRGVQILRAIAPPSSDDDKPSR